MRISIFQFSLLAIYVCATTLLSAEPPAEIQLWPDGLPPGAIRLAPDKVTDLQGKNTDDRIHYVGEPTITIYRPVQDVNGCAVVIFPGGGYNMLAWRKEGVEIAEWFNSIGVTVGVVKYRVPRRVPDHRHIEPLQDGQRAIRWLRYHAAKLKIDRQRIGVLGFSAGGHLAVMTGTHWDQPSYKVRDEIDTQSCRPDFMCPIYAAYLGSGYKDDVAELGALVRVTSETPPTFLSVTADDSMRGAQSALLFVELKTAGVLAELHIFGKGGHGYGIRGDTPAAKWNLALANWLAGNGLLE